MSSVAGSMSRFCTSASACWGIQWPLHHKEVLISRMICDLGVLSVWISPSYRQRSCKNTHRKLTYFKVMCSETLSQRLSYQWPDQRCPKTPNFNSDEVDTDMLNLLSAVIDSCDIHIISMKAEGGGEQNPKLLYDRRRKCCMNWLVMINYLD